LIHAEIARQRQRDLLRDLELAQRRTGYTRHRAESAIAPERPPPGRRNPALRLTATAIPTTTGGPR
jgi:hypothetical protein